MGSGPFPGYEDSSHNGISHLSRQGMVDAGDTVSGTLMKEFGEEALNSMEKTPEEVWFLLFIFMLSHCHLQQQAEIAAMLKKAFKNGRLLFKGYADDPRNTDNAWMETVGLAPLCSCAMADHTSGCHELPRQGRRSVWLLQASRWRRCRRGARRHAVTDGLLTLSRLNGLNGMRS